MICVELHGFRKVTQRSSRESNHWVSLMKERDGKAEENSKDRRKEQKEWRHPGPFLYWDNTMELQL